jgi:hypothetical protein
MTTQEILVISENSDSRSYYDSHGENLGFIVNSPWWRGLDGIVRVNRLEPGRDDP